MKEKGKWPLRTRCNKIYSPKFCSESLMPNNYFKGYRDGTGVKEFAFQGKTLF